MSDNVVSTAMEFDGTVVLATTDSTTISGGAQVFRAINIVADLDTQDIPIKDGSTLIGTIPGGSVAGQSFPFYDVKVNSLVIDPDNAATTGTILVIAKPQV